MKKFLSLALVSLLSVSALAEAPVPKFSVFVGSVKRIANERKISIAESVRLLMAAGVTGFDCDYREKSLSEVIQGGLKPVNFYGWFNFVAPDSAVEACAKCLAVAKGCGAERIMIVPTGFREGPTAEADYLRIRDGLRRFAGEIRAAGLVPMIEDYGGVENICSHMSYLKRMMDDVPDLAYALDTGNLYYAGRGEDILEMMRYVKGRIGHVHLKDQTKADNHIYASLGLGAVPNAELVRTVASWGYGGWYTFENLVGPDLYTDVVRQIAVVRLWVAEGCGTRGFIPLFNGRDLTGWPSVGVD